MQIRKVCIRSTFMDSIQTDFFNNPNIKYLLRIMKTMNRQHLHQDFTQNGKMDAMVSLIWRFFILYSTLSMNKVRYQM